MFRDTIWFLLGLDREIILLAFVQHLCTSDAPFLSHSTAALLLDHLSVHNVLRIGRDVRDLGEGFQFTGAARLSHELALTAVC